MTRGVTVVGLGKIGLPLAVQIAGQGFRVRGADTSPAVVRLVSHGHAPCPGEPGLAGRLGEVVKAGLLTATTDTTTAVARSDVVVVVVPLVTDAAGQPDYGAVDAATAQVAAGLRAGSLVSYETTLPVHTTRQRLGPALAAGSGLRPGHDFGLSHSPERVSCGTIFADLRRYPKLVGGIDPGSGERAVRFYASVLDFDERPDLARPNGVWNLGSAEAAELTKLAETTYRDVNIALANEFARFAGSAGIDMYQVIEAANSQPFSHLHRPGISVGGHCIPVYPRLYLAGDPGARLPAAAREVNDAVPGQAVQALAGLTGGLAGLRVAVLGAAYRAGVKETAFSGVFAIVRELALRGAAAMVHDPLYSKSELRELRLEPYSIGEPCDAVIMHTDHAQYKALVPSDLPGVRALVDGRAITDPRRWGAIPRRVLGMAAENVTPRRASGQAENVPPQRAGGQAESDRAGWLMPRPHLG
ncbi:MAG TPA: nucleotide sugar dehydrogenase [Streptosporangiaceae bacterium]